MGKKVIKEILSWVLVFAIAFALALFINRFVYLNVDVPSGSMEKTIMVGDKVGTYRLAYLFGNPKRGDIIVFPFPDDESVDYIKRIIGLPGETIEGKNGLVYIDGKPLKEPYVTSKLDSDFGPYKVPADSYFMMGDNRNISADSRYWNNKFVKRDKIIGKALFKYPNFAWLNKNMSY
ncbi:MAG TPA: signal peptidase I [Mobilitalea sp.]|nr:signal peptidase I [Mobilitalea sp.]